jgi:hypothetical protein
VLPLYCPEKEGVARGLNEQRDYERYLAYCLILKADMDSRGLKPFPFDRWRETWAFMKMKAANRTA